MLFTDNAQAQTVSSIIAITTPPPRPVIWLSEISEQDHWSSVINFIITSEMSCSNHVAIKPYSELNVKLIPFYVALTQRPHFWGIIRGQLLCQGNFEFYYNLTSTRHWPSHNKVSPQNTQGRVTLKCCRYFSPPHRYEPTNIHQPCMAEMAVTVVSSLSLWRREHFAIENNPLSISLYAIKNNRSARRLQQCLFHKFSVRVSFEVKGNCRLTSWHHFARLVLVALFN